MKPTLMNKTNTMKTIKLKVSDMLSAHCQMRVKNALEAINGVKTVTTEPGTLSLLANEEVSESEIKDSIIKAGYYLDEVNSQMNDSDRSGHTFHFQTNINCTGCVADITPVLDSAEGICHWDVDINSQTKTLSVHSDGITKEEVESLVRNAGFSIKNL